jgi:hypothetical protein
MVKSARREYLETIRKRYRKACKKDKKPILDEFCTNCAYHRKYAIRLLGQRPRLRVKKPGAKPVYDSAALLTPLKRIWFATDQMCSKKLKAAISLWLPHYEQEYGALQESVKAQLLCVSPRSIDRLLKPVRAQSVRRGLCGTRPGTLLKNQICIRTEHWDVTRPGFVEADTVAHCGNSLAGDFVWSLTLTDILSGWTENRATWNKGALGVMAKIEDIEATLPFSILGFDCDNGSEFLNHHLHRYLTDRPSPAQFTRSRPYHKNDSAHVEQKNWTHVRQLFGYDRFDKPQLVNLMNDLYLNEWRTFQNFFCPTLKLKEKQRINSRYIKKYHPPQTPCQRLLESNHVCPETKKQLMAAFLDTNPFVLKKIIQAKLKIIFDALK